jgi:hypothetical protein
MESTRPWLEPLCEVAEEFNSNACTDINILWLRYNEMLDKLVDRERIWDLPTRGEFTRWILCSDENKKNGLWRIP